MPTYRILNRWNGQDLGVWKGDGPLVAFRAHLVDVDNPEAERHILEGAGCTSASEAEFIRLLRERCGIEVRQVEG